MTKDNYIVKWLINDNQILLTHYDLIKALYDDRSVAITYRNDGSYCLYEACDEYFCHILTKEECIELSELFKEIAEMINT